MIGSVPPARDEDRPDPEGVSKASCAILTACESGRRGRGGWRRPARARPSRPRAPPPAGVARPLPRPRRDPGRGQADGEVRLRLRRDSRVLQAGLAADDPVDVDGRLGGRAEVELVGRALVVGDRARLAQHLLARRLLLPACALLGGGLDDADPQRAPVPARRAAGCRRASVVSAWMAFSAALPYIPEWRSRAPGADEEIERRQAAGRDRDRRQVAVLHPAVEDHARVGAALVLPEELDDRLAADLLLAVRDDAQVDRQGALGREQARRVSEHPELALVVGGAPRVEPLAADGRLERVRLPEIERRRRLHVEVRVAKTVGASSAFCDARISPITSGRSPHGTSSASPPLRRILSAIHSAAATTSSACAGSALTDGMRRNSESSSSHAWSITVSLTRASLVTPGRAARHYGAERELVA